MHWVFEYKTPDGLWIVNSQQPPDEINSSQRESFTWVIENCTLYSHGIYRLAPRFKTKPVAIRYITSDPFYRYGNWLLETSGVCDHCGRK